MDLWPCRAQSLSSDRFDKNVSNLWRENLLFCRNYLPRELEAIDLDCLEADLGDYAMDWPGK